jgi:hypothetical protein
VLQTDGYEGYGAIVRMPDEAGAPTWVL